MVWSISGIGSGPDFAMYLCTRPSGAQIHSKVNAYVYQKLKQIARTFKKTRLRPCHYSHVSQDF